MNSLDMLNKLIDRVPDPILQESFRHWAREQLAIHGGYRLISQGALFKAGGGAEALIKREEKILRSAVSSHLAHNELFAVARKEDGNFLRLDSRIVVLRSAPADIGELK